MKHFSSKNNQSTSKDVRRALRQNANTAEQILWRFLRGNQLGFKFRRQFDIRSFIADFYCHELRLVIELDGWTHDSDKTKQRDEVKQKVIEVTGCKVIRIKNEQAFGDIAVLLEWIQSVCLERADELRQTQRTDLTPRPSP